MPRERERREEVNYLTPILIVICIISALVLWYIVKMPHEKPQDQITLNEEPTSEVIIDEPEIRFPVPESLAIPEEKPEAQVSPAKEPPAEPESAVETKPVPTLDEEITALFDWKKYGELFLKEAIINNFVVTIDNMTAEKLPQKYSVTTPPPGNFLITVDAAEKKYMDPRNFDRYKKYVEFVQNANLNYYVRFYVKHYSLFQKAYQELGYPNRYFNDRFVEVIDHLLNTPTVQGQLPLEQPKYYYTMVDNNLENLSAGQKILIRIGPDNARIIKARLQELRKALTSLNR